MDDLLYQMGMRILARRKELRLTQEQLAEYAQVTAQTISAAELGKKALRPENIIKICSALGISTDYLLLGKTTTQSNFFDEERIEKLSDEQRICLERIIYNFLIAARIE